MDQATRDDWRRNGGSLPAGLDLVPSIRLNQGPLESAVLAVGSAAVPSESSDNRVELVVTLAEAREDVAGACAAMTGTRIINAACLAGVSAASLHALQAYGFQTSDRVMGELADQVIENVTATPVLADDLDSTLGRFLHFVALKYLRDISDAALRIARVRGNTEDTGIHLGLSKTQTLVERFLDVPFGVTRQEFEMDMPGGKSRSRNLLTGERDFEKLVLGSYAVSRIVGLQHASEVGTELLTMDQSNRALQLTKIQTTTTNPGNPLAYPVSFVGEVLAEQYLDQGFEVKVPAEQIDFHGWKGYVLVATR